MQIALAQPKETSFCCLSITFPSSALRCLYGSSIVVTTTGKTHKPNHNNNNKKTKPANCKNKTKPNHLIEREVCFHLRSSGSDLTKHRCECENGLLCIEPPHLPTIAQSHMPHCEGNTTSNTLAFTYKVQVLPGMMKQFPANLLDGLKNEYLFAFS